MVAWRSRLEFTEIGIEVPALDHVQLLGFERALVSLEVAARGAYGDSVLPDAVLHRTKASLTKAA
jgi:hypothetical protein